MTIIGIALALLLLKGTILLILAIAFGLREAKGKQPPV